MYLYLTDSGDTLFYGIREVEKRQLSKVYSEISESCSQGKRYCYINFHLTDRVKELLIHEGFHIQVEYYKVSWTRPSFLQRVKSKILILMKG